MRVPSQSQLALFVRDFFIYAAQQNRVAVAPPPVEVMVVPELAWASSGDGIEKLGQMPAKADWLHAFAAVSYMSSKFEERLKVMQEMQAERPGEYDRLLDAQAFIWVRMPSGLTEDAAFERHSRLATATIQLIQLVVAGGRATRVLNEPDSAANSLYKSFLLQMSPDEFAQKYATD